MELNKCAQLCVTLSITKKNNNKKWGGNAAWTHIHMQIPLKSHGNADIWWFSSTTDEPPWRMTDWTARGNQLTEYRAAACFPARDTEPDRGPQWVLLINNQPVTGREISPLLSLIKWVISIELELSVSQSGYSPTTRGPPRRPPRWPLPQRTSARLDYQPHSYTWLSHASASAHRTGLETEEHVNYYLVRSKYGILGSIRHEFTWFTCLEFPLVVKHTRYAFLGMWVAGRVWPVVFWGPPGTSLAV